VRRTAELRVVVLCPHFQRPVEATRNTMNERLIDCTEKDACRTLEERDGTTVVIYPQGCPVFRR
jgi:hypothetical protein